MTMTVAEVSPVEQMRMMDPFRTTGWADNPHDWAAHARPSQLPPPLPWRLFVLLAGRGFGKTRAGCEAVRDAINNHNARNVAIVGRTASEVRDIMVDGDSGMLAIWPPHQRPKHEPSKRRITFHTGATATTFSADEPDMLRGENSDLALADELASWKYPEAWTQLLLGLRIGNQPRVIVTTTPRPTPLIRDLVARPGAIIRRGSTYDNRSNLAGEFLDEMLAIFEGTRTGRQELHGEILDDAPGALWTRDQISRDRCELAATPEFDRIVVGVDPASTGTTGIVVCAVAGSGNNRTGFVLADRSVTGTPDVWAAAVAQAYHDYAANEIIAEGNFGGTMVKQTIEAADPTLDVRIVTASKSKQARAEPVATYAEKGRVRHVGFFDDLEDELTSWEPGMGMDSPDRLDAMVWAMTRLLVDARPAPPPIVDLSGNRRSNFAI